MQRKLALVLRLVACAACAACGIDAVGRLDVDHDATDPSGGTPRPGGSAAQRGAGAPPAGGDDSGTVPACEDGALAFDGHGEVATVPAADALDLDGDFTVEAWVAPTTTSPGAEMDVVSRHDPYASKGWALLLKDGRFEIVVWGDDIGGKKGYSAGNAGDAYVVPGKWTYVVGTLSGDTLRIYADGKLRDSQDVGLTFARSAYHETLAFGRGAWAAENAFAGDLAEVRLSKKARATGDTTPRPNAPLVADDATVALWGFDETAGSTILDASKHGHDGVLAAATQAPARTLAPCVAAR